VSKQKRKSLGFQSSVSWI